MDGGAYPPSISFPSPAPPKKPPQATGPCSWACRRRIHKPPHSERNEAPMPPAHGAWARLHGAKGSGRRHCRPLLVGLSPSARTAAPSEPKRSKPAPCSWGGLACPSRRRLWPAALPPPCSWACRRRIHKPPHSERNEAPMPPARGAWALLHGAEGSGWRHCRPLPARGGGWRCRRC